MKFINYIIFFMLLITGYFLKDSIHISTNLLALFAPKESIEKLAIANELGYSKEMFIAVKGFDKNSKQEVKAIVRQLKSVEGIKNIVYTTKPDKKIQRYFKEYYYLLASFNNQKLSDAEIQKSLHSLYNTQQTSFFYTPIDKKDPLKLFHLNQDTPKIAHKGKYLTLADYGYLIKVTTDVAPSEMDKAKKLYTDVHKILSEYKNVVAFAGFFYSVENSAKIKADVKWIVLLSTIMLLIIYFVMLRSIKLLTHTTLALASSMAFAALICTTTIENFGVLSLAFGTSLTAVSIDYFFHYYFHDFYVRKRKFDKSVFFGYLTTVSAFGVFAFIPVPMISQISIFALLSLSFAYLIFTFVFPYLDIKEYSSKSNEKLLKYKVSSSYIMLLSFILLGYSVYTLKFDDNIRHLDYQNIKLQQAQALFEKVNKQKLYPVIVEASSQDELLERLHKIKEIAAHSFSFAQFVLAPKECERKKEQILVYDFDLLKKRINNDEKSIGFRDGYFKDAYDFVKKLPSCSDIDLKIFSPYNLETYKQHDKIYTMAMVDDLQAVRSLDYVHIIDVKEIFAKVANQMLEDIVIYSFIVLFVIMSLLVYSVRSGFFYALNYILFPLSLTLAFIVTFFELNIMHLFALIILIAIGIDYGIYMSSSKKKSRTMLAIRYSLLSTFAAFGVLIFSSITALNSIGLVISIGCGAIYLLIKVMR